MMIADILSTKWLTFIWFSVWRLKAYCQENGWQLYDSMYDDLRHIVNKMVDSYMIQCMKTEGILSRKWLTVTWFNVWWLEAYCQQNGWQLYDSMYEDWRHIVNKMVDSYMIQCMMTGGILSTKQLTIVLPVIIHREGRK